MGHSLVYEDLDDIVHSYDYGIVPGSASVFVKDEENNIGKLDLTLLEGVMIIVELSKEGYKVESCSPLASTSQALAATQTIQTHFENHFETMDNLLVSISPMFRTKFQQALYEKLESVHHRNSNNQEESMLHLNTNSRSSASRVGLSDTFNNNNDLFVSPAIASSPVLPQQNLDLDLDLDLDHASSSSQDVFDLHAWIIH